MFKIITNVIALLILLQSFHITLGANILVNLDAPRHAVNDDIYGVNNALPTHLASVPYTANRWSGNPASRYNWEVGNMNSAISWLFMSTPDTVANVSALPEGTQVTIHVDASLKYNSIPMLTIPMIGWVQNDNRTRQWGFSVKKYGAQKTTECTRSSNANWCNADMGEGVLMNGTVINYNNPYDTSKPVDDEYGLRLAKFMKARGTPVKHWALDNEIDIWSTTHRDIYKNQVTYDIMWNLIRKYGSMVRAYDPTIQIFAPSLSGWCGFWFSDIDNCAEGADRADHNNLPVVAYFLNQTCSYKKSNGIQVMDYLDIHFYPPALGSYNPSQTSDWNSALRLRNIRNLYDFNYIDESWIGTDNKQWQYKVPAVIPRMKNYIQNYCPEIKLAISEYNYGGYNLYSSGLSQIEILHIFAKYGVDYATYFQVPTVGSIVENAFRYHLNFDGNGTRISGNFVNGTTCDVQNERVTAYTYHDSQKQVFYISVINKLETNETVRMYLQSDTNQYGDLSKKNIQVFSFKPNTHNSKGVKYLNSETSLKTDYTGKVSFVAEALSAYLLVIPSIDIPIPTPVASTPIKPVLSNITNPTISSRVSASSSITYQSSLVLVILFFLSLLK